MNKMIFAIKAVLLVFSMGVTHAIYAGEIIPQSQPSLVTSCAGANTSVSYYIPNGQASLIYYPRDIFYTNKLSIITSTSEVLLYQGIPNYLGSSCRDWSRPANIAQGDRMGYIAVSNYDGCIFTKRRPPSGGPVAQVVYKIHYKEETGKTTGTSIYTYAPEYISGLPNTGITSYPLPDQTKRTWTSENIHANECRSYYVSYCGDGVRDNRSFDNGVSINETCDDGNNTNGDGCSATCQTEVTPSCTSLTATPSTGNAPLNVSLSCAGVSATSYRIDIRSNTGVIRTITAQNGTHTFTSSGNYTATCYVNGTVTSVACQRSITVTPPTPSTFDLALKKYVNSVVPANDAQTPATAVAIAPNTNFTYVIRVTNNGPATVNGTTTVTDPGPSPAGIAVTGVSGTGWTCTRTGNSISCSRSTTLASGSSFPDIVVTARTPTTSGIFTNTATVANPGDTIATNNTDPANVRVGTIIPLIHIDKRDANPLPNDLDGVVGNDTQMVYIGSGAVFRVRVTNTGSEMLTNVRLTDAMAPNCSGSFTPPATRPSTWSNFSSGGLGNHTDTLFEPGEWFEYTCSRTNTTAGGYTNSATVIASGSVSGVSVTATDTTIVLTGPTASCASLTPSQGTTNVNPNTAITYTCTSAGYTGPVGNLEYNIACGAGDTTAIWTGSNTRVCNAPNAYSASQNISCSVRDRTVPTVIFSGSAVGACLVGVTTTGGGGGGSAYVGKKCVNNIATCATYNSIFACTNDGIPSSLCYPADAVGYNSCQTQYLDCGGGNGGGGGCGNGVLEGGEECDVVGAPWCQSCQLQLDTTPGENPIIDLWMTIPTLSRVNLGYSWIDGENGKIKFEDNRMVLGVGTKAFTLADTVGFGIRTRYMVPLMIEASKPFCLASFGNSLNAQRICTTAGTDTAGLQTWTRYDGKKYIILGKGDYQVPQPDHRYTVARADSNNNIVLFRGPKLYTVPSGGALTLNSAFWGSAIGTDGVITLSTLDSLTHTTTIDLVSLSVRVSGALVGTTNTPVNRSIETFVNQVGVTEFLNSIKVNSTTTAVNTDTSSSSSIAPIQVTISSLGDKTVTRLEDIPVLNGNQNIRAVKGNLTINCPAGSNTFVMEGVRTILVEGNIIFRCNTAYPSNDATSSWAWIAKGGDIEISNGIGTLSEGAITNLAGIYVAIKENGNGGDITFTGNATTQKILKIEGSLYGDATGLFNSRLYARGTSAYEILTTGTIISYSNRALVNPPPLLSQYLNNYNVQRVVR